MAGLSCERWRLSIMCAAWWDFLPRPSLTLLQGSRTLKQNIPGIQTKTHKTYCRLWHSALWLKPFANPSMLWTVRFKQWWCLLACVLKHSHSLSNKQTVSQACNVTLLDPPSDTHTYPRHPAEWSTGSSPFATWQGEAICQKPLTKLCFKVQSPKVLCCAAAAVSAHLLGGGLVGWEASIGGPDG